jgi:hypothetical protein
MGSNAVGESAIVLAVLVVMFFSVTIGVIVVGSVWLSVSVIERLLGGYRGLLEKV